MAHLSSSINHKVSNEIVNLLPLSTTDPMWTWASAEYMFFTIRSLRRGLWWIRPWMWLFRKRNETYFCFAIIRRSLSKKKWRSCLSYCYIQKRRALEWMEMVIDLIGNGWLVNKDEVTNFKLIYFKTETKIKKFFLLHFIFIYLFYILVLTPDI